MAYPDQRGGAVRAVSDPVWRALRRAEEPVSIEDLHRITRARRNAIQLRLNRWRRVGFVMAVPGERELYEIDAALIDQPAPTEGALSASAWTAMRRIGRPATFAEILQASGAADRPLYCRLYRWVRDGHVVKTAPQPTLFVLTDDAPDVGEPPKVSGTFQVRPRKTARDRMWSAMRVLKRFDLPLLMMTAEATRRSCEDFINLLSRAGYIRNEGYRAARTGPANLDVGRDWSSYTLLRSTGPKAPKVTNPGGAERQLIDQNNGCSVPIGRGVRELREARDGQ